MDLKNYINNNYKKMNDFNAITSSSVNNSREKATPTASLPGKSFAQKISPSNPEVISNYSFQNFHTMQQPFAPTDQMTHKSHEKQIFANKSKALTIYDPSEFDSTGKKPIAISANLNLPKSVERSNSEIVHMLLIFDPPIVGTVLKTLVYFVGKEETRFFSKEFFDCRVRWFRGIKRVCSVQGCLKSAEIQCLCCVKLKISQHNSYFCSNEHLALMWPTHKVLHLEKTKIPANQQPIAWNENDGDFSLDHLPREGAVFERSAAAFQCSISKMDYEVGRVRHGNMESRKALSQFFPPIISNIWADCATTESYVPGDDDAGRQIMAECTLIDKKTKKQVSYPARCWTSPVLPRFSTPPERLFVPNPELNLSSVKADSSFRVMSYNVLAEIYANTKIYPYIQQRFLDWTYRYTFIMGEILRYRSHVVCLQEVQYSHYEDYFRKRLEQHNYAGIFKKKTRTSVYSDPRAVDGCAIFYDKSVFRLVQQFTIEFNEAADGLFRDSEGHWPEIVKRLAKDNVAVVCLLEDVRSKKRICVANTHLYWDPLYADVKLWQTLVLCHELQMLSASNFPTIICGDFNSKPDSAVYKLLSTGLVPKTDPIVAKDKLGVFARCVLAHGTPFMSAYKMVLQREPKFTNYTMGFKGCIDYVMYSRGSLQVLSVLDEYPESVFKEHTALPSPRFASDHIQLVAEFAYVA